MTIIPRKVLREADLTTQSFQLLLRRALFREHEEPPALPGRIWENKGLTVDPRSDTSQ